MSKAEKHPDDEGKYQSTFDNYGHGKGNGKSRASIYKHHKKFVAEQEMMNSTVTIDDEWDSITSMSEDELSSVEPTIPKPIRKIVDGDEGGVMTAAQVATQKQMIRWGFLGLDRLVTHWGRGVMSKPEWEIERHESDYDALEGATTNLLDSYGISMSLSPELVFGTVVGAAYVPPVVYVSRNADPNRKKGVMSRIRRMFNRRRKTPQVEEGNSD